MLQWLWCWFAFTSRLSEIHAAYISLMMSSYSSFYDDVLYVLLLYRFALNSFPSWKRWVELKLLRPGHRRKGVNSKWRTKRRYALGWQGRVTLSDLLDKPRSQVSSLPPPGTCLHFYHAEGSAFPLLVDFHRTLLTHALALPAKHFFGRKIPVEYMHSVRIELGKLI